MAGIRPIDKVANKWGEVTPLRASQYADGVQNPRRDWATSAGAANATYARAVTVAAQAGRYGAGVKKAGSDKWQKKALSKGPNRFSEGVMLGKADFQEGFAPYHEVIARTELPPRGPKGDPANINRVAVIAKALSDKKQSTLK